MGQKHFKSWFSPLQTSTLLWTHSLCIDFGLEPHKRTVAAIPVGASLSLKAFLCCPLQYSMAGEEQAARAMKAAERRLKLLLHISEARNLASAAAEAAAAATAAVVEARHAAAAAAASAAAAADAGPQPLVPQGHAIRSGGDSSAVALHIHAGPQPLVTRATAAARLPMVARPPLGSASAADRLPPLSPAAAAARWQLQLHCPSTAAFHLPPPHRRCSRQRRWQWQWIWVRFFIHHLRPRIGPTGPACIAFFTHHLGPRVGPTGPACIAFTFITWDPESAPPAPRACCRALKTCKRIM